MIKTVLFDLDGTFVDTAFDLIETANLVFANNHKSNISYEVGREIASDGVKAFLRLRFNENRDNFNLLSEEFLTIYNQQFLNNPLLFDGIEDLLLGLERNGLTWGIVTNKPKFFADDIVKATLGAYKPAFLICPDDTGKRKPSPDGLVLACKTTNTSPEEGIYIGDHSIDIIAGKAAGMKTVAAAYGYVPLEEDASDWKADYIVDSPIKILEIIS